MRVDEDGLLLGAEADAVPVARHYLTDRLRGTAAEPAAGDAELVLAELLTNALLHAGGEIRVRVGVEDTRVRLEVEDGSPLRPLPLLPRQDAMTGRGLTLVAMLTTGWGVEPGRGGGKIVWAELDPEAARAAAEELAPDSPVDVDALLAGWSDLEPTEPRHRVVLGDVPTDLLLSAKAHVDNLLREFALAASGAASGQTAALPVDLARLIDTVVTRFAEARQSIKRQAVAAAAAGAERTHLELTLPVSAADAGLEYLAALDEVDSYARAARLLTLETPAAHLAFRHWYVEALVAQLRAIQRGEQAGPPATFEQHLLTELVVRTREQRASAQAARLQAVTAALAGATTPAQVAQVVVSEGVTALGAAGGGLLMAVDEDAFDVPAAVGYPAALVDELRREGRGAELPAAHALRTGESVWLESRTERDDRFPALAALEPHSASLCAVPLVVGERRLGALRLSFHEPRLFGAEEREFVLALAAQTTQALDRALLYAAEREARADAEANALRLARMHRATAMLAAATEESNVVEIVIRHAADTLEATYAAFYVLDEDGLLHLQRQHPPGIGRPELWRALTPDTDLPVCVAVRDNVPVLVQDAETMRRHYPEVPPELVADDPLACVPVSVGERRLGALVLTFPRDRAVDAAGLGVLATIGQQCGLALDRARLFRSERAALDRVAFLDSASGLLSSSLEPPETVEHLAALLVPELADWAVIYLLDETGDPVPTTVVHRDPSAADGVRERFRTRGAEAVRGGLDEVIRTGRSRRHITGSDAERARAEARVGDDAHARRFLASTGVLVAMQARGAVVGALALARLEGPEYSDDEVRLVEDLAARAAVAVANAQQYDRERETALALQRGLLPQRVPSIPGVRVAWRYLPGAAGMHVGGDWYDVIALADGRIGLLIGDVMGRGVQAAGVMGQLRALARIYATTEPGPSGVLARLDEALGRLELSQITTAAYAVLDPRTRELTIASAGHLPPLVVPPAAPDGSPYAGSGDPVPTYLEVEPGPPLGAGAERCPERTLTLPERVTLLFFTDGLVEDRRRPVDVGMGELREAVPAGEDPEALCDAALAALGRDVAHDDDTAVLAVTLE